MTRRLCTAVALLALLTLARPIVSQDGPTGAERDALLGPPAGPPLSGESLVATTEEVALLMRCPVCQGLSIADSPTLLAQAMKAEVKELLADGYSEEQVMIYFEQSYGEFIRLEPKAQGFNLLVWLAPVGALALGAWFVIARGRSTRPGAAEERVEAVDPEIDAYRVRVRQELATRSGGSGSGERVSEEKTS
jgi:cytochrome c-type biogenesis protein CcmH